MAPLDVATLINAVIAALALAMRGNMLKPEAKGWASSRTASLTILFLSVSMGAVAIDVYQRGGSTLRELGIVFVIASSSVVMLVHLWMQRRAPSQA
jgi:hypothetical protein